MSSRAVTPHTLLQTSRRFRQKPRILLALLTARSHTCRATLRLAAMMQCLLFQHLQQGTILARERLSNSKATGPADTESGEPVHNLSSLSLDKESRHHDAETSAERLHPDRADDRGCDHRYPGRSGHPGLPGLHRAGSGVRGPVAGCCCQVERGRDRYFGRQRQYNLPEGLRHWL